MRLLKNTMKFSGNWITISVIIILLLSIGLRFTNLDQKVYWIDEVHTSLRVSGYTRNEFVEQAPVAKVIDLEELQKFQRLTSERNFGVGVKAIASSEHSPLYYVLARLGMEWLGSSLTVTRGVAAVISLLSFPCMYFLAQELFASTLVGMLAVALMAVSPFHLLYAQEAREYSLLTVTMLFSCWTFLKAIRGRKKGSWALYAVSVALGLYAHPLALFVFVAHGIYAAIVGKFSGNKLLTNYVFASGIGIVLFSPWIWVFIFNGDGVGGWIQRAIPLTTWLQRWCLNLSSVFFDLQVGYNDRLFNVETGQDIPLDYSNSITYTLIPILLLIAYSLYYLVRRGNKSASIFILLLIGATAICLGLPDLISGGQRSTISRYIIPVHLGIELAVAYCLASKITAIKSSHRQRTLWQLITIALISGGIWCCGNIVTAKAWWNKYSSYYNPQIAKIIEQSSQPLILGNTERISRLTSLSYLVPKQTKFMLFTEDIQQVEIPLGFSDVFLFKPYEELIQSIQQSTTAQIEPIEPTQSLWQIK